MAEALAAPRSFNLVLDYLSQQAGGAIMHAVRCIGQLSGAEQPVHPSKVVANCSLARDPGVQAAAFLLDHDLVDEPIRSQVYATLPQALLKLRAVASKQSSLDRPLDCVFF